jgi:hypothetical protein
MLGPVITLRTPGDIARSLVRYAGRIGYPKPLRPLAYNRFAADRVAATDHTWWITPGPASEQVAYWRGKIVITRVDTGGADFLVGLYVEKGLSQSVYLPQNKAEKHWLMSDNPPWLWPDFIQALRDGLIDQQAANAVELGGRPLLVTVDAGVPHSGQAHDIVAFEWDGGSLASLPIPRRSVSGHLRGLDSARTLRELAEALLSVQHLNALWIDLTLGFPLWIDQGSAESGSGRWNEDRLWQAACAPWGIWLR